MILRRKLQKLSLGNRRFLSNKMKIDVPYYKSVNETDCGPIVLKMVLEFFGEEYSFDEISKAERQIDTGLVWSVGIARAAKKLGFRTKMISQTNFRQEENDIEYYRKYASDNGMIVLKELADEIKKIGVEIEERNMSLDELLSYVAENSVPIVLVNWYVLAGKEGFSGHFLPITGYDEKYIYVHNPGLASAQDYLPLKRENFLKAWESKGTDKDVVIVFRK